MSQWKPKYDKPPFQKLRILRRTFKYLNWVHIYPAKTKKEFSQACWVFTNGGIKPPRPSVSFETNTSFPNIKRFAWELSVFDAGYLLFTKIDGYLDLDSDYPRSNFIKKSSTIAPSNTFFNRRKAKQKTKI